MSNQAWLIVALIVVALVIGGYAASLTTRLRRLRAATDARSERR